jgi:DNA helicase-2/ATP-dependent DNA helicase PcrA
VQLLNQNAMDFDDTLIFVYRILTENPSVVKLYTSLYKYICVDEAQDLNFAQYEVIKALCGPAFKNIMLVGDEKQSVYGFNGSDSTLMSKTFVLDFCPTVYKLNENFRSAKTIVEFANNLQNSDSIANYVYEGELCAYSFKNEKEEADFVIKRMQSLLKKGHRDIEGMLRYDDFAVIGRNKYVLSLVKEEFDKLNMPYFYKRTTSGVENESDYMKVFDLGLRLVVNPSDNVHLRELCKLTKVPVRKKDLTDLEFLKTVLIGDFSSLFDSMRIAASEDFNFTKVLQNIKGQIPSCFGDDDKYLIENDISQWENHWQKYISQVQREYRSLLSFRNYISLGKTQDASSETGIALLSAHMSKGLQYNVVFILGLSEGTFPDYRAIRGGEVQLEQEKNNMYVAVTRAKRLCYLTYPELKLMPWGNYKSQAPSRYIKHLLKAEAKQWV